MVMQDAGGDLHTEYGTIHHLSENTCEGGWIGRYGGFNRKANYSTTKLYTGD